MTNSSQTTFHDGTSPTPLPTPPPTPLPNSGSPPESQNGTHGHGDHVNQNGIHGDHGDHVTQNVTNQTTTAAVTPTQRKTRSERVALHMAPQGIFAKTFAGMKQDHYGMILFIMFVTSLIISAIVGAWDPPFTYRLHDIVHRAIVCNTDFRVASASAREIEIERVRKNVVHIFYNDAEPLDNLRENLWSLINVFINARTYENLSNKERESWNQFLLPRGSKEIPKEVNPKNAFEKFIAHFKDPKKVDQLNDQLRIVFSNYGRHGLITTLDFNANEGNIEKILVYQKGESVGKAVEFKLRDVQISDGSSLRELLQQYLPSEMQDETFVDYIFNWIYPQLRNTLTEDKNETAIATKAMVKAVKDVYVKYAPGRILVESRSILDLDSLMLLRAEYDAAMEYRAANNNVRRIVRFSSLVVTNMILFVVCWGFLRKRERRRPQTPQSFLFLMALIILTVATSRLLHGGTLTNAEWELLPILIFVMTVSIMYSWELAVVFSFLLVLIISFGGGGAIGTLIVLFSVSVATAIQLGRLRSRNKLLLVSFNAGLVAFILTIAVGLFSGRELAVVLFFDALTNWVWSFLAGLLMTGLLPFIEGYFGILTDMSLLDLGSVSHPLLQSLNRLAPATYGHSIQVGTIAETAADAIGARGLLTRVGAYFHDIGKIMKPEYYTENQGEKENIHDKLEPQVSTIVVVAHVKDGVDLARQHHLPKPLIDLIEQHHGTSLVSFFFGRAKNKSDQPTQQVDESTFRYPGPKPQTKEAAILMIADACESACRSMGTTATPGKVENKVHVIIKQKLDDGQFDDSGLTLKELKTIENSVIKSIIAANHGRIRYPGQVDEESHKASVVSEISLHNN
ncbi:MAG: HDIG domain-containing protein [Planctomycetaceae bacterium]|jgi:putative nucleotidyltransferase with HDIG domain|nr:HDIG domain-containing protein [Planctomycetaceae bacterium]